jgi:hypothetical protein
VHAARSASEDVEEGSGARRRFAALWQLEKYGAGNCPKLPISSHPEKIVSIALTN